jgi:hypothetical protein
MKRRHGLEGFAAVSAELSVHTWNSHLDSLQHQHESPGRTFRWELVENIGKRTPVNIPTMLPYISLQNVSVSRQRKKRMKGWVWFICWTWRLSTCISSCASYIHTRWRNVLRDARGLFSLVFLYFFSGRICKPINEFTRKLVWTSYHWRLPNIYTLITVSDTILAALRIIRSYSH